MILFSMNPHKKDPKNPKIPVGDMNFITGERDDFLDSRRPTRRTALGFADGRGFHPDSDIHETKDGLIIVMEIPGMDREEVDIKLEGRRITVSGSREFVKDKPDEEIIRLERGFGSFSRTFELPDGLNLDAIAAKLDLGVLTISVPIRQTQRTIPVEPGD